MHLAIAVIGHAKAKAVAELEGITDPSKLVVATASSVWGALYILMQGYAQFSPTREHFSGLVDIKDDPSKVTLFIDNMQFAYAII